VNTCEAYIVSTIHVHEPSANSRQPTADLSSRAAAAPRRGIFSTIIVAGRATMIAGKIPR